MIIYNIYYLKWHVNCEMWKRAEFNTFQSNITIASNLTANICLLLSNLDIIWFNLKTPEFFSDFEQLFY